MTLSPYPVVRLKPKADARRVRFGHPWVFADEVVTDRRTKALSAGAIVEVQDTERRPLGIAAVNPGSKIFCRLLSRDTDTQINAEWVLAQLTRALELRARFYDAPFYRLIHAEGDGLPGVVIDRFGDTAVFQPNAAWADAMSDAFVAALNALGMPNVVINGAGRARVLEGLPEVTMVASGAVDGPISVPMNGASYMADLLGGQKTGLFFDQRPNHAFAARLAKGARVLDVFSHVGGFALAALAAGGEHALCVDGSAPALELAQQGATVSGLADRMSTRKGDAFAVLEDLAQQGERFDVVICDPPAFAPNKQALEAGVRAYERVARLAAPLVRQGGYLGLCSCSHAVDLTRFRTACTRGIGRAGHVAQLLHTGLAGPDHPMHPQLAETGYLKALFYRVVS